MKRTPASVAPLVLVALSAAPSASPCAPLALFATKVLVQGDAYLRLTRRDGV